MLRVTLILFGAFLAGCAGSPDAADRTPTRDASVAVEATAVVTARSSTSAPTRAPSRRSTAVSTINGALCEDGRVTFETPRVDLEATELVVPLGLMSGSHVTPVDHIYFQNYREPTLEIDVYSPAAGTVKDIQHMSQTVSDGAATAIDDYRLVIEHSCSITSIFIHVATLAPALAAVAPPPGEYARVDVPLQAGELIGTYRANVDYNVVDADVTLPGLLVPEHYSAEPWKIHAAPPFQYFSDRIREELVSLSLRAEAPFDGRFDYDIDGRLVGTWFQQGTNGYAGASRDRYWAGHLAVAYDYLDPSHVVISLGTFDGVSTQVAVRGNAPDPADVSVASGLVAYELVSYDYWVGDERWDRVSLASGLEARNRDSDVRGVVLFQLLDDRTLKVETFPGKSASEVAGFTIAALTYER